MEHTLAPEKNESPFFGLLAEAEEIKVRELDTLNPLEFRSGIEKSWEEAQKASLKENARVFFVCVKGPQNPLEIDPKATEADHVLLADNAWVLLNHGDYLLAKNLFSFLFKRAPRDPVVLKGMGICHLKLGDIVLAKKCFSDLEEIRPEPELDFWFGACAALENQDSLAEELLSAPHLDTLVGEMKFDRFKLWGNALTRLGKYAEAFEAYQKALSVKPDSDIVYVNLGTLHIQVHKYASARIAFMKALEVNPKNPRAYVGIGLVSMEEGLPKEAFEAFDTALNLDSQQWVAVSQMVLLSETLGGTDRARKRVHQFLQKEPNHEEALFWLCQLLFIEKSFEELKHHLDAFLARNPNHAGAIDLKSKLEPRLVEAQPEA